jgi:hypothetical protein
VDCVGDPTAPAFICPELGGWRSTKCITIFLVHFKPATHLYYKSLAKSVHFD